MLVYLMRHGQTDWNKQNLLQGRSDISLNEVGVAMAEAASGGLKDIHFDLIISSPLKRAYETAEIIRGDRDIPIITDDRIIEMSFGEYEGFYYNAKEMEPDDGIYNFFFRPDLYVASKGGETVSELKERTTEFLIDLAGKEEYRDKTILVTAHGAAISSMISYIKDLELRNFWKGGVPGNCAATIITPNDDKKTYRIVKENVSFSEEDNMEEAEFIREMTK